jgi:AMMECR1 domain-containing protein
VAGFRSGLFLPQVATENNWDLETFLDQLMLKAGLWPDYWKENPVDFYVFEAEVFGKSD